MPRISSRVAFPRLRGEQAKRRYALLTPMRWREFSGLRGAGVSAAALIWPDLPARASVVFDRRGTLFDFAEEVGDEGAISALVFLAPQSGGSGVISPTLRLRLGCATAFTTSAAASGLSLPT